MIPCGFRRSEGWVYYAHFTILPQPHTEASGSILTQFQIEQSGSKMAHPHTGSSGPIFAHLHDEASGSIIPTPGLPDRAEVDVDDGNIGNREYDRIRQSLARSCMASSSERGARMGGIENSVKSCHGWSQYLWRISDFR
jgi:hypothetical protein